MIITICLKVCFPLMLSIEPMALGKHTAAKPSIQLLIGLPIS